MKQIEEVFNDHNEYVRRVVICEIRQKNCDDRVRMTKSIVLSEL